MNEIAAAIEYLKTHAANIRAGTYGHAAGTEAWAARVDAIVAGLEEASREPGYHDVGEFYRGDILENEL